MKTHPGIWFTLWSVEFLFLLGFAVSMLNMQLWIRNSIEFFAGAICFYGMVYYHVKWIQKLDQKYYKKQTKA